MHAKWIEQIEECLERELRELRDVSKVEEKMSEVERIRREDTEAATRPVLASVEKVMRPIRDPEALALYGSVVDGPEVEGEQAVVSIGEYKVSVSPEYDGVWIFLKSPVANLRVQVRHGGSVEFEGGPSGGSTLERTLLRA